MTLRKVINGLANNPHQNNFDVDPVAATSHIPFRECKLTSILKQSLIGRSYCLMVACI
jgi:hypothetical protein